MRRQRITAAFRSLAWRSDKFREGVLALAANTGLTLVLAYLATTPLPKAERGQISKAPAVWTFQQIGGPAVAVDFDRRLNRTVNGECCTGYYETAIDRSTTEGGESRDFSLLLTGTTGLSRVEVDGSNWPISSRESTQIVGPLIPILTTSDAAPRGHNISVRVHISSPKTVWAGFWDSPPVFGPASELRPLRDHLIFYRQQLPLLTSFAFLIIGILSLWLSLRIRNSEVTLSFAELSVAMIGFALFYLALSGQIRQTFPVAGATIHTATRGVAFLGMARFLMRLSGRKSALRRLTAIAVVGIVAQLIGGYHDLMSLVVAPAYVSVAILTWATWCFATTATLQKSWGIIAGTATVHCLIATADLVKYTLRALGTDFGFQYLERYHSPSLLIMALVFILTAFVEAAKASTTLEARKRIADQVAHDIRSPIAAINAVAKGDQPIDQEARELLKSSIDRVRRACPALS